MAKLNRVLASLCTMLLGLSIVLVVIGEISLILFGLVGLSFTLSAIHFYRNSVNA